MSVTAVGARAAVRRSNIPLTAWGEALGVTRQSITDLANGKASMQSGPLMTRLRLLVDALANGRAGWVKGKDGTRCWRLESREVFGPQRTYAKRIAGQLEALVARHVQP